MTDKNETIIKALTWKFNLTEKSIEAIVNHYSNTLINDAIRKLNCKRCGCDIDHAAEYNMCYDCLDTPVKRLKI